MSTKTRTIRGTYRRGDYFEYRIGNKDYWVQGEVSYNRAKERYEHIHEGARGGEYLIVWYKKNRT